MYLHIFFFFFNDTATTEIYTLSLHDALPISRGASGRRRAVLPAGHPRDADPAPRRPLMNDEHRPAVTPDSTIGPDRKSTRLNSSHANISYAVFCLKKKKIPKLPICYSLNDAL